jgi:hypothetical protein
VAGAAHGELVTKEFVNCPSGVMLLLIVDSLDLQADTGMMDDCIDQVVDESCLQMACVYKGWHC